MKKFFGLMLFCATMVLSLSSCSKDHYEDFDFPIQTLYGKWEGTVMRADDISNDIENLPIHAYAISITFSYNGKYYMEGFFGEKEGTYKATGNMINAYIDEKESHIYVIKSLTRNIAEFSMENTIYIYKFDVTLKKK